MAKTVFFNIPSTGHINPTLPVIAELVRQGEEVVYVNTEEVRAKIEATGARFVAYPDLREMERLMTESVGEGNIPRNMRDLVRISGDVLPFALQILAQEQPDYLMIDTLASWGKLAAKKSGLPLISFVSTFVISPSSMPPMPLAGLLKTMGQMFQILPSYFSDALRFRQQHGMFPVFLIEAVMSLGDLNIVFTSREFQPGGNRFDDNFKFVGVTITQRTDEVDFPFDQLTASPKVYISLGTLAKNDAFLRTCFEACKDEPGQFVLSAGKQTDLAALAPLPENFIVRNFVPQLEVLQRVNAFITHGGINSVHEGLFYGVPLVVVPQQAEQAIVAQQVEKHGAGVALPVVPPYGAVSAEDLRTALRKVLTTPTYAANAKQLGQSLVDAGGVSKAVTEILAFVEKIGCT